MTVCTCTLLYNFIEVLGTVYHGGEMIDISDGNSILHQHSRQSSGTLKKSLNNVLLMFCRVSPF